MLRCGADRPYPLLRLVERPAILTDDDEVVRATNQHSHHDELVKLVRRTWTLTPRTSATGSSASGASPRDGPREATVRAGGVPGGFPAAGEGDEHDRRRAGPPNPENPHGSAVHRSRIHAAAMPRRIPSLPEREPHLSGALASSRAAEFAACCLLRGAPVTTRDVGIVYDRSEPNVDQLAAAVATLDAWFRDDERKVRRAAPTCR